jgi:hypothetical protein
LWWVALSPLFWYNGIKENTMETEFLDKCAILDEFRYSFLHEEPQFEDFMYQHDSIMLPLARLIHIGDVIPMEGGVNYINSTWTAFLKVFDIEDSGFQFMYEILLSAGEDWLQYV